MQDISTHPILATRGIIKDFPGQRALDHVDFDVYKGEVHALIGENGAGKSTLIKIIAGVYQPDAGKIMMDGEPHYITNPSVSRDLGLAFIHQDLHIIPHLSVAENILLGIYPRNKFGLVSLSKMVEMVQNIPDAIKINGDLRTAAGSLSIIDQWKVIINRALALRSRVIFMDEPTASLAHNEVNELFQSVHRLKELGKAIVYVSHRIEEIFKIADRITVIKDSKIVGTALLKEMDTDKVYQMMLGREFKDVFPSKEAIRGKVCLEVKNLTRAKAVQNVSFQLHEGEILGIAGLVGSGRTELARLLFGADRKDRGEILVTGEKVDLKSPRDAINCGIGLVPEERRLEGLVLSMGVKQNITLASLSKFRHNSKIPILSRVKEKRLAEPFVGSTAIKTSGLDQIAAYLSGGNQQKVVLSKWLCSESNILIFDEPTKGIDVGAKFAFYDLINSLARSGSGIILISSDLTEVVGLSHRILVMHEGKINAELLCSETDLASVLRLCLGEDHNSKAART